MRKSPSQIVKDKFGDKAKLVAALKPFLGDDLWVGRLNESKGLAHVSNAKLLRLLNTFGIVKAKWGSRAKLIDAIVEAEARPKDAGWRGRLETWPVPRLFDHYRSVANRKGIKLGDLKAPALPASLAAPAASEKAAKAPAKKAAKAAPAEGAAEKPKKTTKKAAEKKAE
jgi:hypothetical protein